MNEIPEITDPMGRYWDQPDRSEILIDDLDAVMSKATFDKLAEYSCSQPTGVYPGKMWKASNVYHGRPHEWFLKWFGYSEKGPDFCSNNTRAILLDWEVAK